MQMIDMAKTGEEIRAESEKYGSPVSPSFEQPRYPYGLAISLSENELAKLGLDSDCDVGDLLHLNAMAEVTSVSKYQTTEGDRCRVELQITMMGVEDETHEFDEEEKPKYKIRPERLYNR